MVVGTRPILCENCHGERWVCENHRDKGWPSVCECGAGAPCPVCSPEMACAGYAEEVRDRILHWLRNLPKSDSGWNDHDEWFDNGHASAVGQIIEGIIKRDYAQ